jgi:hypothetical protein
LSGEHFIAAPSSAARRIQCTQSVTLEAQFPETEETEEQREGTAAHWAVSEQLSGRLVDVGQVAPNGVILTDEMLHGADLMYDDVVKALAPYGLKPTDGQIEMRVKINRVYPGMFGSPDFYILITRRGLPMLLLIWDYKFGHRVVDAYGNAQMIDYIAGATEGISDITPGVDIVISIVQPRSFHREGPIRRWTTNLMALRAAINISSNAVHEALGANPRARVGPECRDCRARHACPKLQAEGFAAMDEAKHIVPLVMDAGQAGLELRMLDRAAGLLKARREGLVLQLESLARQGKPTPGWRLEQGESRERWTVPAAQVIATGKLMLLDLAKPTEAITPRQAREKGFDPAIVAAMAARGASSMTLVEDDGTAARKVFG